MTGIAALILVVLGLGVTVGLVKPRRVGRFILGLMFGPILIAIGLTVGRDVFDALPPVQKVAFVVVVGVAVTVLILRMALPRGVWEGVVASFIYDILRFLVALPFRAVAWVVGFRRR